MNKAELVHAVAERAGSSPAEARRHVDAVLASIVDGVSSGERVSLTGFGTFDSTARPARTARNPRTGAAIDVPAAVVPRFRVGASFKTTVAGADGAKPARQAAAASSARTTKKGAAGAAEPAAPTKDASKDDKKKSSKKDKSAKKDSKKKSKDKKNKKSKKK